MPFILLKDTSGKELKLDARNGETLLAALGRGGLPLSAPCGGKQRCGKCKVKILEGHVSDVSPGAEYPETLPPGVILACRSIPETDVTLALVSDDVYDGGSYQEIFSSDEDACMENAGAVPRRAGVAMDIGTTTVSARLVDLETGRELDTYSALNKQRVFGADVMSRIAAARSGKTQELFETIKLQTQEMLSGFMQKFSLSSIETLVVAGNTVMLHLFVNEDPSLMGEVPFTPVFLEEREFPGSDLSLSAEKIFLFPSISAFIGGDIVSGLAAINILESAESPKREESPVFFIDIGTNGEMALFHKGRLFCTSAAAGPALEGAEISCGVGSIRGAINKVEWISAAKGDAMPLADPPTNLSSAGGKVKWSLIGGGEANIPGGRPAGICGCGLIDAIAIMLEQNIIDETGALTDEHDEFAIAPGVSITGRDVRQFQLAKGAILSAIKILFKNAGVDPGEAKKVYVAGGLGFYIDKNSAVRSGLLPEEFLDKIEVCGNTSLKGAVKALLDKGRIEYCKKIQGLSETMELASDPAFVDAFAENMIFP